jgi:hypothetical protein
VRSALFVRALLSKGEITRVAKTAAQVREMMTKEQVIAYTGYADRIITGAYKRGELRGEKPGGSLRSRVYFNRADVDAWIESIQEEA